MMEQIETQASDLRYLAHAPVAVSESPGVSYDTRPSLGHAGSPGSASVGDNSAQGDTPGGFKRKLADDSSAKQTRSKRNRYISIACNECKRRKIKCNGETPCHRCGNLNLACLYAPNCCTCNFKDTDEFKQVMTEMRRLQDQVGWLSSAFKNIQGDAARTTEHLERSLTVPSTVTPSPVPSLGSVTRTEPPAARNEYYRGPTSAAFSLDVANSTISNMGYQGITQSDEPPQVNGASSSSPPTLPGDPILAFDEDEILRLCHLHEHEVGIMYPVVSMQTVVEHARSLTPSLEAARKSRSSELFNDEKTLVLKAIMCCALAVEEHGNSEKAAKLFSSMETVLNRKLMADACAVSNLPLLALMAGYRFLSNDEVLAWRVMGQQLRLCLELGIHRKQGLMKIKNESDRRDALNSFWSAYVLDRRWAFGTGLPYAVQDEEIDPQLPMPDEYPYLVAMITYSKLGAKVWRQVSHFGPILARELRYEEIERLDQEILRWYDTVPEEVKVQSWTNETPSAASPSYNLQRLRIWTYLRRNQIRIWLHTPVLHSATSIMSNLVQAQRAVDMARDTIRYLSHLNNTTAIYRKLQVFYHQFLTSAISVVFLASVHCPVRFSAVCREEFYMALDLVQGLSARSWVSKRLWSTIRALKEIAPRFGLNPDDDRHSNAALGMIGLARGESVPTPVATPNFQGHSLLNPQEPEALSEPNGVKIQSEMSRIFEGYVGLNGASFACPADEMTLSNIVSPDSGIGLPNETVYTHLRDMF